MGTTITLTSPSGTVHALKSYVSCTVNLASTNKAGSFRVEIDDVEGTLLDAFPVGTDVQINQDGRLFRGWILNPTKALNTNIRMLSFEGYDYSAKTQKVVVTESYIDKEISFIVNDLVVNYLPWVSGSNIEACSRKITIKFSDSYFWDAMEKLCEISGYEWRIDASLIVQFFQPSTRVNPNVIGERSYKRGTASLKPDATKLVNKLWVKGGKILSDVYTQAITVNGTEPIQLFYKPRAPIEVVIGGQTKSLGVQHVHAPGEQDFLLNYSEKLLIPDQCTSGAGTVSYKYEYPFKLLLEEPNSQAEYGVFEDIYKIDVDDRAISLELGLRYLEKYSQPVLIGELQPFNGTYEPGEQLTVKIPKLNLDRVFQVKEVQYTSVPTLPVDIRLSLEG